MQIRVLGSNIDLGSSLTEFVNEHIEKSVKKYFENAVSADAHFSKQGQNFKVILVVNEGVKKGIILRSDGEAGDAYGAFAEAIKKIENQLRRYKERIKDYHKKDGGIKNAEIEYGSIIANKYVLPPIDSEETEESTILKPSTHSVNHKIISEKNTEIERLSVDEAIMKMDLQDLPALAFINEQNGKINVVYHRKDGNISWINPC